MLGPALAAAQQPQPTEIPPEAQEIVTELQEIQAQLEPIQEEALQDPDLQAEQQELGQQFEATMMEVDPETPERMARLDELVVEAQTAQREQNAEAVTAIMTEAQEIQLRLEETQAEAVERPEVAPRIDAFRGRLQAKMAEIDPEAQPLIDRANELDARLAEILSGTPS